MVDQEQRKREWIRRTVLAKLYIKEHEDSGQRYLSGYCHHWLLGRGIKMIITRVKDTSRYAKTKNPPDYLAILMKPEWDPADVFNPTRPDYYDPQVVRERKAVIDQLDLKKEVMKTGFNFVDSLDNEDPAVSQALVDAANRVMVDAVQEDPNDFDEPKAD